MTLEVAVQGPNAAVISGVAEEPLGLVEVESLRRAVDELDERIDTVVVTASLPTPEALDRLIEHARPLATARAGVDALKRVDAGRVVETLDRRKLYIASLPVVTSRAALATALATAGNERCAIADLVSSSRDPITLVDDHGELIGRAAS